MTPEELIKFGDKLGYEVHITSTRDDLDITTFGDTEKRWMPMTSYTASIKRCTGGLEDIYNMNAYSWDELQVKLIRRMTT